MDEKSFFEGFCVRLCCPGWWNLSRYSNATEIVQVMLCDEVIDKVNDVEIFAPEPHMVIEEDGENRVVYFEE